MVAALVLAAHGYAQTVTWGAVNDPANGIIRAADIPSTTAAPVVYSNLFGDGFNIAVTTSGLQGSPDIGLGSFFGPSWFFEGPNGGFANVGFQFFDTASPATAVAVSGVHFRIEDVDEGEVFKEFSYIDAAGVTQSLTSASPVFTFSSGLPDDHLSTGSFDVGGTNQGGSQPNKWIDVDFSALAIRGFSFRPGRLSSSAGSVELTALGEIRRYLNVGGAGTAVTTGQDLRGISSKSAAPNQTLATILDGNAGGDATLTMAFNTPGPGLFQAENGTVYSDVLALSGTGTGTFVLQLSYDDTGLSPAQEAALFLSWYDPVALAFVNAVNGNTGGTPVFAGDGAYDPSTDFNLGTYGVDTYNNTVWAVINHNSEFAVVPAPEPSSLGLLCTGAIVLLRRRRK